MKDKHIIKDAINFEDLKKQKEASETELKIHQQWLMAHPNSAKAQQVVAEEKEKIIKINLLLEQEPPLPEKNAIDFEELKKQKKSYVIGIEVHEEWLALHPNNNESQRIVSGTKQKIAEIDALLQREPPIPELPPSQPLVKISGILEEIDTLFARGYFSDREYDPEGFAHKEANRQWGSVILAMIGQSAAAAVNSQDEIRSVDGYDFVKGKIDGIPFHGWLGLSTAKKGDYVELIAIAKDDHYEVYALTMPELRTISIIPHCYQGIRSKAKFEVLGCFVFPFFGVLISAIGIFLVNGLQLDEHYFETLGFIFLFATVICTIMSPFIYFISLKKPKPSDILAQNIFKTLKIKNPQDINLEKITKIKIKKNEKTDRDTPRNVGNYYY